jgi:hypothetical protein
MSSTVKGYFDALCRLLRGGASTTDRTESREAEGEEAPSPASERKVIVRSEKGASDGQVTAVQAAIRNGWRLVDIEVREETGEEDDPTEGEKRRLAFILRRPDAPSRRGGD